MSDQFDRLRGALTERYTIERELGAGGMATVYLAEDVKHDRKVALKVLRPELTQEIGVARFVREIKMVASLTHPHILPLFDSGEADGFLYFVMPALEGDSLRDQLKRKHQLSVEQAVQIAREVADALDYAHKHDVIHRDIKPENVMLHGGHAVVADFGIGKAIESAAETNTLTQIGITVGTPHYMSPEQASGEQRIDGRSDLYSLGCMFYEMLAGKPPFTGPTAQAVIAKRFIEAPPEVIASRPAVPASISRAVGRLLATSPDERYATGAEFIDDLQQAVRHPAGVPAAASGAGELMPSGDTRRAIVVLPFANRSPDAENEYFSDGLTEEIIADLSAVRALSVISRTSSMQLKGTDKDVRTIGRELGVQFVLEGSVRKAGNSLRITTQLIDATSDEQLWAEKYSGTTDDVFDLQERVSREIVSALDVTLTSDEDRRLADHPIADVRAFELYLQAREELRGYRIERASALLAEAVKIEGETPPLLALMTWAKVTEIRVGRHRDMRVLDEAEIQACAVLERAPHKPYGNALLAYINYERGDQPEAVRHCKLALELEPNDADMLFYLGIAYIAAGQNDQAVDTARRFIACDPLTPLSWVLSGISQWFVGQVRSRLGDLMHGLALDPQNLIFRWTAGYAHAVAGQVPEATKHADWMRAAAPGVPYTMQLNSLIDALNGEKARALVQLAAVDVTLLDAHNKFHLGESFAMAGDTERAIDLVEQAVDEGFYPYLYLAEYCPFMEPLRGTPRYEAILDKAKRLVDAFE